MRSSATNNLIGASDHASIQVDIANVDKSTGVMIPDQVKSYVFCGSVRAMGETDDTLNRLATEDGILHEYVDATDAREKRDEGAFE